MPLVKKEERVEQQPIDTVTEHWNKVVEGLQGVKNHWDSMQQILGEIPRDEIQSAPMQVQKAVARFRKAKFEVMLERFLAHYRAFGGLEAMKVKKGA